MYTRKNLRGITIIEFLIAITLSAIILTSLLGYLSIVNKNYLQYKFLNNCIEANHIFENILSLAVKNADNKIAYYPNGITLDKKSFFVENTGRKGVHAFYLKENNQPKTELVENIKDLQIDYFIRENNHLLRRTLQQLKNEKIVGLAFQYFVLNKKRFLYVATR